jgi:DNA-binding FadR family transcriptional regulator
LAARPADRESAGRAATRVLAGDIISGVYAAGARLPIEQELATILGVGRSTVREAVKILVSKGLLEVAPKRGTFVRDAEAWHHLDPDLLDLRLSHHGERDAFLTHLAEIRLMFEPFAAEMAATRRSDADMTAIYRSLADMREADPGSSAAIDADIAFHAAVVQAAHNPLLRQLSTTLEAALRHAFNTAAHLPAAFVANIALHQEIADAVARQDPKKASAACRALIARAADDQSTIAQTAGEERR